MNEHSSSLSIKWTFIWGLWDLTLFQAIISLLDRGCRLSPPLLNRQVFRRHLRSRRSSYSRSRGPADHVSSHEYVSRLRINTYHRHVSSLRIIDRLCRRRSIDSAVDHVSTRIIDHVSTRIIATYHRSTLPSTISSGDPAIIKFVWVYWTVGPCAT